MSPIVDELGLKEMIREIVKEELLKLTLKLTPCVSYEEMQDIEKTVSEADLTDDNFVDGMKWLGQ